MYNVKIPPDRHRNRQTWRIAIDYFGKIKSLCFSDNKWFSTHSSVAGTLLSADEIVPFWVHPKSQGYL